MVRLGINLSLLVRDKDVCIVIAKDYFGQGEHMKKHSITIPTLGLSYYFSVLL